MCCRSRPGVQMMMLVVVTARCSIWKVVPPITSPAESCVMRYGAVPEEATAKNSDTHIVVPANLCQGLERLQGLGVKKTPNAAIARTSSRVGDMMIAPTPWMRVHWRR
jgi:hypothetical protein